MAEQASPSPDELRRFNQEVEPEFRRLEAKILAAIAAPRRPPRVLYHYTDMAGFRGIVQTGRIWATDIRYLNDAKEFAHSNELYRSVICGFSETTADDGQRHLLDRLSRTFDFREMGMTPFVVGFSAIDDDLGQWRGYAKGIGGVALGFDLSMIPAGLTLEEIDYDEDSQKRLMHSLVGEVISLYGELSPKHAAGFQTFLMAKCGQLLRNTSAGLLVRFKSRHWRSEKEWRLVDALLRGEKDRVRFRSGHLGLIPYIEVAPTATAGVFTGRLPLTQVVLGPHPHQELSRSAMRDYLSGQGYHHTEVRVSDVPLRF